MSEAFYISYYILIVALVLLAIIFLIIPLPKAKGLSNYTLTLRILSFSYVILAGYCIFKSKYPIQLFSVPFLIVSMLQAHFLTLSHINMVNPRKITPRYIIKKGLPLIVFIIAYLIISIFEPHVSISHYSDLFLKQLADGTLESCWYTNGEFKFEVIIRLFWVVYYIILSMYYCMLFFKEEHYCKVRLQEYTSDYPYKGLTLIRISFILVIAVAINSIFITLSLNAQICAVLNFIMLLLYCAIGLLYLQYPKVFLNIYQSTDEEKNDTKDNTWETWKEKIIASEIYLTPGITIQQICQELCTNRKTLSSLINQEEGCNFNTFINKLRVEKAKQLMINGDAALLDISLEVGYSDQANFSRHFKEITGESPTEWRKNNSKAITKASV